MIEELKLTWLPYIIILLPTITMFIGFCHTATFEMLKDEKDNIVAFKMTKKWIIGETIGFSFGLIIMFLVSYLLYGSAFKFIFYLPDWFGNFVVLLNVLFIFFSFRLSLTRRKRNRANKEGE